MKHTLRVTFILAALFLIAQIIGLLVINEYLTRDLPLGIERPEIEGTSSYLSIVIAIAIATMLALLLIKFKAVKIWKLWFFFATVYLLSIVFSSFLNEYLAMIAALLLGLIKFLKPNFVTHNFTELFVYSGIAAIFVPIMNILAISILLILISFYDYIAVWKTKHMIEMAKFQVESKIFAGLLIPYNKGKKSALLGGGDVGFPMLFSGVVLNKLGGIEAFIVALSATIALFLLLSLSKKNKVYPAMPFLSLGCFIGLGISSLF